MDKIIALCPFCDSEQRIEQDKHVVKCDRCGKAFNNDTMSFSHPDEFWSNPDTSTRF